MPRQTSEIHCDPTESVESVLMRAPSSSLQTPTSNKHVSIRPLKRMCIDGQQPVMRSPSPPPEPIAREELSPRKLDMDQEVVLACQAAGQDEDDDEDDERVEATQPYVADEVEEGEIPVLTRTDSPGNGA
jgi:hypothetical protein